MRAGYAMRMASRPRRRTGVSHSLEFCDVAAEGSDRAERRGTRAHSAKEATRGSDFAERIPMKRIFNSFFLIIINKEKKGLKFGSEENFTPNYHY